jgi:hypothetical protein
VPLPLTPPTPDLSSGPSGDAGFAAVESLAYAMVADTRGLPRLMVRGIEALYRNAALRAELVGEPAEAIFHSFVVNGLVHLLGDDYYHGEALEAVLGLDRGALSPDVLHTVNTELRINLPAIDDTYRTVSVGEIVLMAQRLTAWAPHMLRYLKVTGAKLAEIEDLAVIFAPAAIYYVNLLRSAFDDFPHDLLLEVPPPFELPVAVPVT